jgi:hypothetical protein
MSYDAVNSVTKALRVLLQRQLNRVLPNAIVSLLPPGDALAQQSGVNLYLYRVSESPSTRNEPWRGDRSTPPSAWPPLGLQLFYLLTPLGTKPDDAGVTGDDAHTMLGAAMLLLHENPVLNDIHISGFDADAELPGNLLDSYEQVKVTLLPTTVDDLSKIWSTINQPYRLSVAYEVSIVELTPTTAAVQVGGAGSFQIGLTAGDAPRLSNLSPASGALAAVAADGTLHANALVIHGFGFSAPIAGRPPDVLVGGRTVTPAATPAPTDQALTVGLPTDLDAGPQADVRVAQMRRTSLPLSFTVSPWLAAVRPIRTALDPARGDADMKPVLTGSGFTTSPQAVRLDGPAGTVNLTTFAAGGSDTRVTVTLPATLANGLYQARVVRGDGGASNPRPLEVVPRVDSPIAVAVVAVTGKNVHQLTINGARLGGKNIRVTIAAATYQVAPDPSNPTVGSNPAQLVVTLGRLLAPGSHTVVVTVDGHAARGVALEVNA